MQLRYIIAGLMALAIVAGNAAHSFAKEETDETMSLSQTPKSVQKTIKAHASEAEIKRIEKGDEDGKVVYEVQLIKTGKKTEITIASDGTLLSVEEEVSLSEVPEAVRKTIQAKAGSGKVESVEKVTKDGKTSYEAKVTTGDKKVEIKIASDGKLLDTEDVTGEKD